MHNEIVHPGPFTGFWQANGGEHRPISNDDENKQNPQEHQLLGLEQKRKQMDWHHEFYLIHALLFFIIQLTKAFAFCFIKNHAWKWVHIRQGRITYGK